MQSLSQNDIAREIKQGIQEGIYKNCLHLTVYPGASEFVTQCKKGSFQRNDGHPVGGFAIGAGPASCPNDCNFFEDKAAAEKETAEANRQAELVEAEAKLQADNNRRQAEQLAKWDPRLACLAVPFKWFGGLQWQTQLAIILLLILLIAPRWVPQILNIIKAIK